MIADTPMCIWAYANDITVDPKESGVAKAMEVSKGYNLTIRDEEGVVLRTYGCDVYELFITLVSKRYVELPYFAYLRIYLFISMI